MCGISGKIYFDTEHLVTDRELRIMTDTLVHRGPDGEGVWAERNVGLAHRRLAIIDLSPRGHQPMCDKPREIWLTYNGELYNFKEIRQELRSSTPIGQENCRLVPCGHWIRLTMKRS